MSNLDPSSPHRADGQSIETGAGSRERSGFVSPLAGYTVKELHDLGAQFAFDLLADTQPRPPCRRCDKRPATSNGLCEPCFELLADIARDCSWDDGSEELVA